jgi:hypothetical protein
MAANVKLVDFWVVAQRSLVGTYRRFRGKFCLYHKAIALMMEAVSTSETSVNFRKTIQRNNTRLLPQE